LFRRLNSYSKQHALYRALKAFGQIPKSLFILQVIDVCNPREFLQAEKEDQEMAEACKRLIKNCIICWNYLYLSQRLDEITDTERREALLDAVAPRLDGCLAAPQPARRV
jgi:TnpA family transposase